MLIIESVVLEDHNVRREKSVVQIGVVDIARLYEAQGAETPLELWEEARCVVDGGMGETAGEGGTVELAVEDAAVETGIVGRVEELVEATACKHERQEQARGRGWGLVIEREDDEVLHCVLEERKRGEAEHDTETRKGTRRRGSEDIKDRAMEGCRSFRQSGVLNENLEMRTPTSRCCVTLYGMVELVRNDDAAFWTRGRRRPGDGLLPL